MVRKEALYALGKHLQLEKYIILGRSFKHNQTISQCMVADAFEALIGAVYLDGGLEVSRSLVIELYHKAMEQPFTQLVSKDAKTKLQEWCQKNKLSMPIYHTQEEPEEEKADDLHLGQKETKNAKQLFLVRLEMKSPELEVSAYGQTKKKAQMQAANAMLTLLENQIKQQKTKGK